jgi:two-component system sensor histidine kinase KdpD
VSTGNFEQRPEAKSLQDQMDNREKRGKLTVFLAAAAGAGKTFTMLETAHQRLSEGLDVVIGCLETHGRQETERLVAGIPRIAAKIIESQGQAMTEMDTDAIIKRNPELVLVDELAHANIQGSCHLRRFQDVEDLLQAGINVYTTLNIQHIESLNDVVARITGIVVKETVPDYIIEQADSVQLIDIPSDELIKRLTGEEEYLTDPAEPAKKNFFRPGNINALRELALRFTAKRVDRDLHQYMQEHQIAGPWPAAESVMVCVSTSPFSAQIIRAARRLAAGLQAELIALHIEARTRRAPMSDRETDRAARNMRLAEELGAKVVTVVGDNIVQEILDAARRYNVSSIVIGKPKVRRIREFWQGSIVDKLTRDSGGINITVIQGNAEQDKDVGIKTGSEAEPVIWSQYVMGLMMTVAVTLFCVPFRDHIDLINIALLYQLPVTMSAFWWGRWPSYFVALVAVAMFNFLFVPPLYTFNVADIRYVWSFVTFLIVAFVIGGRTEWLRVEAESALQRERITRALYEFSKGIAAVVDLDVIAQRLVKQAADTIGRPFVLMLPGQQEKLSINAEYNPIMKQEQQLLPSIGPAEMTAAIWAFEHGHVTGRSTETFPDVRFLFIPLITNQNTIGVLGVRLSAQQVSPGEKRLIDAWASLAALAIERVRLAEQARKAALLAEADKLRTALFNSISHELRTPLSSIVGSVSSLLDEEGMYTEKAKHELLENVQDGALRMERVVANLLDTARLESGMMQLKNDWCDMQDIIGAALQRLRERSQQYLLRIKVAEELELIRGDCVLLELVVLNLIDNAMKYSPKGGEIAIEAEMAGEMIKVSIFDQGIGIPADDLEKVFDKFYRVRQTNQVSGTGLGLSICKGIIAAHGGDIWAERQASGGTAMRFCVPVARLEQKLIEGAGDFDAR